MLSLSNFSPELTLCEDQNLKETKPFSVWPQPLYRNTIAGSFCPGAGGCRRQTQGFGCRRAKTLSPLWLVQLPNNFAGSRQPRGEI